ncbi:neurexin-3 [Trichonephila clavipes]|nr:neurexin-3 [Trichonephila clavipes]
MVRIFPNKIVVKFQGAVKDVVFTSDDGIQKAQELQESQGIRTASLHPQFSSNGEEVLSADDHCEKDNPCLNGGACISTDGGPICDCRATDYEGDLCEQIKHWPRQPSGHGREFVIGLVKSLVRVLTPMKTRWVEGFAVAQVLHADVNGRQQAEVVVDFSPAYPRPMEIPCVILTA